MDKRKIGIGIIVFLSFLMVVIGGILLMISSVYSYMDMLYISLIFLLIGLGMDSLFFVYIIVYFIKKNR